jgi:hypothetical protein
MVGLIFLILGIFDLYNVSSNYCYTVGSPKDVVPEPSIERKEIIPVANIEPSPEITPISKDPISVAVPVDIFPSN